MRAPPAWCRFTVIYRGTRANRSPPKSLEVEFTRAGNAQARAQAQRAGTRSSARRAELKHAGTRG